MPSGRNAAKAYDRALRRYALAFPGTHEDHPWGEHVAKVGKKVFVFFGSGAGSLSLSVKLPESSGVALMLPFTAPTNYGLGKSGWVTASFELDDRPPIDLLREWIEESYRAVAPKKLVSEMEAVAIRLRGTLSRKK